MAKSRRVERIVSFPRRDLRFSHLRAHPAVSPRKLPALLLCVLLAGCAANPAVRASTDASIPDPALQRQLEALAAGFHGDVGIYVRHLRTGATAAIHPDQLFPTASMVKVPLLANLFHHIERGELDLDSMLVYRDSMSYGGSGIAGQLRDSARISLDYLAFLTSGISDNTAALWIQELDGGGAAVNEWLAANGFQATRVNSRTPGREQDRERYGWGQTSPREIATFLARIRHGDLLGRAASDDLYRLLTRNHSGHAAISGIPPWVQAATKDGAVNQARSQTLLVNAPSGDYVLAVLTSNQADSTWVPENEGWTLIRNVSRAVYRHFEPEDPWQPAEAPASAP
jgi:beta-lactamase class A